MWQIEPGIRDTSFLITYSVTFEGTASHVKRELGGSAAGGGLEFQAAASALCMVYMARGAPLCWVDSGSDIPLSVSAETGGAGDDIALQLASGSILEIQAKRKLQANSELLVLKRAPRNGVS